MLTRVLTAVALALLPSTTALAHPHLFVAVDVTVIYEGDRPTGVQVAWIYDDYFSLLLTTDLGIDLDGDMVLTRAEETILAEAVTTWPADFGGDLEVVQNGAPVTLGPPRDHRMSFDAGIVREVHVRPLMDAADAPLRLRVYDPFYYIAYHLNGPVRITGREDCTVQITAPDLNTAYSKVEELLYGRAAADVGPDEEFPEVGAEFAEIIDVTCAS